MLNIINFSEAVMIAVHAMAVAAGSGGKPVTTGGIAGRIRASENHIAKVMQRLVRAGLLDSRRGPAGGFTLRKKPEEITLLEIFRVIEGEDRDAGCVFRHRQCVFSGCVLEDAVDSIEKNFREYLESRTLADLKELTGNSGEGEKCLKEA